jgi:S1-C subfamily serine protease
MTSVVPVLESDNEVITAVGSAFFVSDQGILLTARHVVDAAFGDDVTAGDHVGGPGRFYFVLIPAGTSPEAQAHRVSLRVTHVSFQPELSDVAIVRADMEAFPAELFPRLKVWPLAHFRVTPGEECMAAGYGVMAVGEPIDESGPDLEWTQRVDAVEGFVGRVFPGGRDAGFARHPCFEVLVATKGGMSGGPVFTHNGLVGVVSGGASDAPYTLASYIATCYQLGIEFDAGDGLESHMFNDLISAGHVTATGPRTGMRVIEGPYEEPRLEVVWPDETM